MEVVLDGWLLKSPPAKRFCKAAFYFQKWRKRWFVLRHSGQLPGQYLLEYYTDATCRKLKGRIDLDQCDRVDVGVDFEHRKVNHHYIFDIRTPKRIYYLVTETESDMNKWVNCICSVCGLKINVDDVEAAVNLAVTSVPTMVPSTNLTTTQSESSPYIPISECISGKPLSNGLQCTSYDTASLGRQHTDAGGNSLISTDFYDYPKPIYNNSHDRTSPEPNMDDMQKVPPLTRAEARNDWENNFTDDDSCPLFPLPLVNWTTYPEDKRNKARKPEFFAYDVPVPARQSYTASRESKVLIQKLEMTTLNNSKEDLPHEQKDTLIFGSTENVLDQSTFPPPRPPKPINIRDKRKYENIDVTTHYDVPPTSKGVFLSKTLPAQVFSFLKDDDDDISPTAKVPVMSRETKLDDMYDFPKIRNEDSLNVSVPLSGSMGRRQSRKHAYSNAPPGLFVTKDTVMNYEYRPGLLPVESVLGEPSPTACEIGDTTDSVGGVSPNSLGTYANVPTSPSEREAPPAVDRNLKPKKVESGITSIVLCTPPLGHGKTTGAKRTFQTSSLPSTGKLNTLGPPPPPIKQQSRLHSDISFSEDDDRSSSAGSRRNSSNDDQAQQLVPAPHIKKGKDEIQYLDLDLDCDGLASSPKSPERHTNSTVYKTVDFIKTKVFNEMRQNVEESYRNSQ